MNFDPSKFDNAFVRTLTAYTTSYSFSTVDGKTRNDESELHSYVDNDSELNFQLAFNSGIVSNFFHISL
jgi:hypothetical protein